jgi:hypothetical protein
MNARRGVLVLAACVVLCVPASASDVTATVKQWMGKWPNEPFNQQPVTSAQTPGSHDRRTFWQFPGTRAGLEQVVGKKRAAVLIGVWRTGDNLKMVGPRWATYSTCMPHNCGYHEGEIFIDTQNGRFAVCWIEGTRTQWLAAEKPVIPRGVSRCEP